MQYVRLAGTGLKVSRLALGCMIVQASTNSDDSADQVPKAGVASRTPLFSSAAAAVLYTLAENGVRIDRRVFDTKI